tara:strand:- start:14013 stop:15989 length:1977 start_codon:yes stop_codon:yes gene_type:complete
VETDNSMTQSIPLFELAPSDGGKARALNKKRVLVGRSQTCDIVINHPSVAEIHAVIELNQTTGRLYDMDTETGSRVNGQKIIVESIDAGAKIQLGDVEFTLRNYKKADILPPPLAMLNDAPVLPSVPPTKKLPSQALPSSVVTNEEVFVPRVEYPLAADPKAEFSEYIFEDVEILYPIFDYSTSKNFSVEVIILHAGRIVSVDYLPQKDGLYNLVGRAKTSNSKEVEFAYLGLKERVPFVEIKGTDVQVYPLTGYKMKHIGSEGNTSAASVDLGHDHILNFTQGDLQIFVRGTDAPPRVKAAPILRRDPGFKRYLLLMLLLVTSFLVGINTFEVDEELEKEKAPERLATILYRKKLAVTPKKTVDNTPDKPKEVVQQAPKTNPTEKKEIQPKETKSAEKTPSNPGEKSATKTGLVKKATPNKGPNKPADRVAPKTTGKSTQASPAKSTSAKKAASTKSKGAVDAYKSFDFKGSMSSLLAKGGSLKAASEVSDTDVSLDGPSISGSSDGATLQKAEVSKNVGSLSGSASGKLDSTKGTQGLSDKRNIYTAGLPYKTVILGGMDPNTIRQILMDNVPLFRQCYQTALDRSQSAFDGVVRLNFVIGASGHVTRAGVDSYSNLTPKVRNCVVNVLKGIKFPEPLGGGVVEVNQPFNFYPKVQ